MSANILNMPTKYGLAFILLLSTFSIIISACPSSCGKAVSKADYIASLDEGCSKILAKVKEGNDTLPKAKDLDAVSEIERHSAELVSDIEALRILPRPKEDEPLLAQYWESVDQVWKLRMTRIEMLKMQLERKERLKNATHEELKTELDDAMAEMQAYQKLRTQLDAAVKNESDMARKYGFKVCR